MNERKRVFRSPKRVGAVITFQLIVGDGCAVRLVDVFDDIPPVIGTAGQLHNIHIDSEDPDYFAPAETFDVDYLVVVESERKHTNYGVLCVVVKDNITRFEFGRHGGNGGVVVEAVDT